MSDFERYFTNRWSIDEPTPLCAISEMDTVKSYGMRVPFIDKDGCYVLTNRVWWILKLTPQGMLLINPKSAFDYSDTYALEEYVTRLFGINIHFVHRYRKYRMYVKPDWASVSYRNFHKGEGYLRYIYDGPEQKEPIVLDLRGNVVSGARQYFDKGNYVSVW